MNKNVRNAVITVALLSALGGGLFYSTLDGKQEAASRTAIADETRRAAQMVELNGLIALDVEPFFKDERVIKLLRENNFRANVIRIGSREMAARVVKDTAPDFFMPSGVVAGNQISEAAKFILSQPALTGQMIALDGGQHLVWQTPDVVEVNE